MAQLYIVLLFILLHTQMGILFIVRHAITYSTGGILISGSGQLRLGLLDDVMIMVNNY